ncbi:hypothetical protein D3C85_1628430 [compost metagenome]
MNKLKVLPENFHFYSKRTSYKKITTINPGRVEVTAKIAKDNVQLSEYILKIKKHIITIVVSNGINLEKFLVDGIDFTSKASHCYTFYLH